MRLHAEVPQQRIEPQALVADVHEDVLPAIEGAEGERYPVLEMDLQRWERWLCCFPFLHSNWRICRTFMAFREHCHELAMNVATQ